MGKIVAVDAEEGFAAQVVSVKPLSALAFELKIGRPEGFVFEPGQWIRFFGHRKYRDYTLVGGPDETCLTLCIRRGEPEGFPAFLAGLAPGSNLRFTGPHGYFTYKSSSRPAVCIATGTGIAPFLSYHRHRHKAHLLLHGVPLPSELYYRDELSQFARLYQPCLSRKPAPAALEPGVFPGRVTDYLSDRLAPAAYDFYLCGGSEMIREAVHIIDDRFPGSPIFTESFH